MPRWSDLLKNLKTNSIESESECSDDEITLDEFMEEYSETEDSDYITDDKSEQVEDALEYNSSDEGLSEEELKLGHSDWAYKYIHNEHFDQRQDCEKLKLSQLLPQ